MSEHYTAELDEMTSRRLAVAEAISNQALQAVDSRYGSGYPDFAGGDCSLPFHNGWHGRTVGSLSSRLAAIAGLEAEDVAIAGVAGKSHDIVQQLGRGNDEELSAGWLERQLRQAGVFEAGQITAGRLAILGTEPLFDKEFNLTGQRATHLEYPTKTAETIGLSLASADLGVLYKPVGPLMGQLLYEEMKPGVTTAGADRYMAGIAPFYERQIRLLDTYKHPLNNAEAQRLLTSHKSQVISHNLATRDKIAAGLIASRQELTAFNMDFMVKANNDTTS